jgi:hypothetical protein
MHYHGIRGGISSWGISGTKLTRLSNLSDWTVRSAWRNSSYTIGVRTLAKIAMAQGVSVSDLIEEKLQEEGEADTTVGEKRQEQEHFFGATLHCYPQQGSGGSEVPAL